MRRGPFSWLGDQTLDADFDADVPEEAFALAQLVRAGHALALAPEAASERRPGEVEPESAMQRLNAAAALARIARTSDRPAPRKPAQPKGLRDWFDRHQYGYYYGSPLRLLSNRDRARAGAVSARAQSEFVEAVEAIALAITGVAIVACLVNKQSGTADVIKQSGEALANQTNHSSNI